VNGLIGRKLGMTSVYDDAGRNIACTVVEAGPCVITQVKTVDTDGYEAVQLGYGERKVKRTNQALQGHFNKSGASPKKKMVEFRDFETEKDLGETLTVEDIFEEGDVVNVIGTSKGKGFQGVVKRHGFHGVGDATHGQHNRQRAPGSSGASSDPSKVVKGMRMAGQHGQRRAKIQNLQILKLFPDKNLLVIKGAIPGHKGAMVIIEK